MNAVLAQAARVYALLFVPAERGRLQEHDAKEAEMDERQRQARRECNISFHRALTRVRDIPFAVCHVRTAALLLLVELLTAANRCRRAATSSRAANSATRPS